MSLRLVPAPPCCGGFGCLRPYVLRSDAAGAMAGELEWRVGGGSQPG